MVVKFIFSPVPDTIFGCWDNLQRMSDRTPFLGQAENRGFVSIDRSPYVLSPHDLLFLGGRTIIIPWYYRLPWRGKAQVQDLSL